MKQRIEIIGQVAGASGIVSQTLVDLILPELIDKAGDSKVSDFIKATLTSLVEASSLDLVGSLVVRLAGDQKNPKNTQEAIAWLSTAIREFGLWQVVAIFSGIGLLISQDLYFDNG
ncbi:unnamed protein product [Protopolystoma xenopodis]|uniref:Uncharacterized protein n=1 Tax=Protopolystoma xenopodis TaxID=117903 RepID=A0A3S5AC95_9PLAT|nr:unnamed protein product [Protopolystoma xenopodis]